MNSGSSEGLEIIAQQVTFVVLNHIQTILHLSNVFCNTFEQTTIPISNYGKSLLLKIFVNTKPKSTKTTFHMLALNVFKDHGNSIIYGDINISIYFSKGTLTNFDTYSIYQCYALCNHCAFYGRLVPKHLQSINIIYVYEFIAVLQYKYMS